MLKSYRVGRVVVVAHEILVSVVLGFWLWGFGVWCLGLTILLSNFLFLHKFCSFF